jgi:cobalamin synthase
MTRNGALAIVAVVVGVMLLFWLLKLAFKLILVAAVAAAAFAVYATVKNRIGGPRA